MGTNRGDNVCGVRRGPVCFRRAIGVVPSRMEAFRARRFLLFQQKGKGLLCSQRKAVGARNVVLKEVHREGTEAAEAREGPSVWMLSALSLLHLLLLPALPSCVCTEVWCVLMFQKW